MQFNLSREFKTRCQICDYLFKKSNCRRLNFQHFTNAHKFLLSIHEYYMLIAIFFVVTSHQYETIQIVSNERKKHFFIYLLLANQIAFIQLINIPFYRI